MDTLSRTAQPRETKPADRALADAERLNSRLHETLGALSSLRNRVSGDRPPNEESAGDVATSFNIGGFVGGVGQAIERAHVTLSDICTAIEEISNVV